MNRFRPALNAVLGLLLIVQGIAVASASGEIMRSSGGAAEVAAAMPCHGDQNGAADRQSCCDADCPNMAACAMGHLAVATLQSVDFASAPHPTPPAFISAPVTLPPASLLRPPISLHA